MSRAAMQAALDHIVAAESEPSWEGYALGCDKARDILRAALAQPVITDEMVERDVLAERERIAAGLERWAGDLRTTEQPSMYRSGRVDGLHDAAAWVRAAGAHFARLREVDEWSDR